MLRKEGSKGTEEGRKEREGRKEGRKVPSRHRYIHFCPESRSQQAHKNAERLRKEGGKVHQRYI